MSERRNDKTARYPVGKEYEIQSMRTELFLGLASIMIVKECRNSHFCSASANNVHKLGY